MSSQEIGKEEDQSNLSEFQKKTSLKKVEQRRISKIKKKKTKEICNKKLIIFSLKNKFFFF